MKKLLSGLFIQMSVLVFLPMIFSVGLGTAQTIRRGTYFAVEQTPQMVALAIDSSVETEGANGNIEAARKECKIYKSGDRVFIFSGIVNYKSKDQRPSFNLRKVVGGILSHNPSQSQVLLLIESAMMPLYEWMPNSPMIRKDHPNGSSLVQVVVAGVENGIPYYRGVEFTIHDNPFGSSLYPDEVSCPGIHCTILTSGMRYIPTTEHPISDTKANVNAAFDNKVSGILKPLQLFTISSSGQFVWVEKPDFCPMIPNY